MGIKSDKTFEEIVERIVALFKPQLENPRDSNAPEVSPALPPPAPPSISITTTSEDETV